MYLSVENCNELANIILNFEVALRSYVVDKIIEKFDNETKLIDFFTKLNLDNNISILDKIKCKIGQYNKNIKEIYKSINDCYDCYIARDYNKTKVLYLSDTIDLIFIFKFINTNLYKRFSTLLTFFYHSEIFQKIRNDLSHPASAKISIDDSKNVIIYINFLTNSLEDKYFWYFSKIKLNIQINEYLRRIRNLYIIVNNLKNIGFQHNKVICRETELESIKEQLINNSELKRTPDTFLIYGYGGVGKTAIALEFIYRLLKEIQDNKIENKIDFILFYSSKEEILKFTERSGEIYTETIKQQINDFETFKNQLLNDLKINCIDEINTKSGLIAIDNFENIIDEEKEKFYNFIKKTERTIKFLITSRNEERCSEEKLHITGFNKNEGIKFIEDYLTEYYLNVTLSDSDKEKLIEYTKGNSLVLITSLKRLNLKIVNFNQILDELIRCKSLTVETLSGFMYKNTYENAINKFSDQNISVKKILQIITYYFKEIDLWSLSKLSGYDILKVGDICNKLSVLLLLNKNDEFYSLNEWANKYILSIIEPNLIENRALSRAISKHKNYLNKQLVKFNEKRSRNPNLDGIIKDWNPITFIDKISIAEAYFSMSILDNLSSHNVFEIFKHIKQIFEELISKCSHPYIHFQRARIYKEILKRKEEITKIKLNEDKIKVQIKKSYEDTITLIELEYNNIYETKSFATVLWFYALFLKNDFKDIHEAIKYYELSLEIYEYINKDDEWFKITGDLLNIYWEKYNLKKDINYFNQYNRLKLKIQEVERIK